MRIPAPGRLHDLAQAFELSNNAGKRVEPPEGQFQEYATVNRETGEETPTPVFDERLVIVQRKKGRRLPLHACLSLTEQVRRALMDLADDSVREMISGHASDGSPLQHPHLAVLPLANVGHRYSDGALMGFGLALPKSLYEPGRERERPPVLRAIGRLTDGSEGAATQGGYVSLGRTGRWHIQRVTGATPPKTLRPERWTRPARCWASVTPVVFGRFPKRGRRGQPWTEASDVPEMVREHCEMIGLPQPRHVQAMEISSILGVPPSCHFPTLSTKGKPMNPEGHSRTKDGPQPRLRAHVRIEFDEPVRGPVILGAGRYRGLGLCIPETGKRA
jgi:CRISPR-associated protein Csb2